MARKKSIYTVDQKRQLTTTRMLIRLAMQRRTIYYSELAERLGYNVPNMALGKVLSPTLERVNQWCWELSLIHI